MSCQPQIHATQNWLVASIDVDNGPKWAERTSGANQWRQALRVPKKHKNSALQHRDMDHARLKI
jgi:hypothetical protein